MLSELNILIAALIIAFLMQTLAKVPAFYRSKIAIFGYSFCV